jgi:hypothetical protein
MQGLFLLLLAVKFSCFLSKRGNILAGKEFVPSFDIVFLGWKEEVPQLHSLFWSQMFKQYRKRILDQRLVGKLCGCVVLSDSFHVVCVLHRKREISRIAIIDE